MYDEVGSPTRRSFRQGLVLSRINPLASLGSEIGGITDHLANDLICDALMGIPPLVTAIGRSRWKLSTKRTSQNPFPLVTQWQGRCR